MEKFYDGLAYARGYRAFSFNQPFSGDHYEVGTALHLAFSRGWNRAMYEAQFAPLTDGFLTRSYND